MRETKWLGQSTTSNTDFLEVACIDGTGFIVASPLPGPSLSIRVAACPDSTRQGVPCRLSDNGLSMQTFKDAMVQHQIVCDATDMHPVGRESIKRRRIVEFFCPQQYPKGPVAFVPLEQGAAPFEVVDCIAAAQRGVICTMTKR